MELIWVVQSIKLLTYNVTVKHFTDNICHNKRKQCSNSQIVFVFQLYWSRKQYVNMYNSKMIRMNKGPKGIARTGKVSHARRNPA